MEKTSNEDFLFMRSMLRNPKNNKKSISELLEDKEKKDDWKEKVELAKKEVLINKLKKD